MTTHLHTNTGSELYTSAQAAEKIGIPRPSLIRCLSRYSHLKPSHKVGQDFLWTSGEITAVTQAKGAAKPGRPAK